jgi:hypothetical protein
MSERRVPLRTLKALEEPPSMVGMEPVTMHFVPLTIPMPATTLAHGEEPDCW